MKNFKNNAGFTLIELMVVIVIVGIMFAIMIPNIGGFISNMEINEAAQNVAGALRKSKELAITKNVRTQLWIVDSGTPGVSNRYYTIYMARVSGEPVPTTTDTVTVSVSGTNVTLYAVETRPISDKGNIGMQTNANSRPDGGSRSFQQSLQYNFTPKGTAGCGQTGDTTIYLQPDKEYSAGNTKKMAAITISGSTGRARIYTWGGSSWQ